MKTFVNLLGFMLLVCSMQSCSFKGVRGNGKIVEKEIAISDYKIIEFSGGASLVYEQDTNAAPYFRIETDENIIPLLDIESNNDVLSIGSNENIWPTKCHIYTNSTRLEKLDVNGAIKAHLKGKLTTDHLYIDISGSGKIVVDDIECNILKSNSSGSSTLTFSGTTNQLNCSNSGSGKIKAESLVADSVYCEASGSGSFDVYAKTYLNVSISGVGKVRYKGDPKVDKSISGIGRISRKD